MKLGNANVNKIRLGSTQMKRVYLGSDIVWQNAPTAIAATGVGTTSFTANWEAYSGATYYLLDVSESSDFSTFIYQNQIVEAPTTSYVVIGVESNTTYYYRVRAGDGALPFQFSVKTDNAGVSSSTQFRMPLTTSTGLNFDVDWGDGSATENITNHTLAIHTYPSAGTYTIMVTGSLLGWRFGGSGDRLKILNVNAWGGFNISIDRGFNGCANLTATANDAPTITSTSLQEYFRGCTNFNGAIGNWDVSNVTNVTSMFYEAISFNQNIGAWDVSSVTSFNSMFYNAKVFNNGDSDDINNWQINTTTAVSMSTMFSGSSASPSCKFNRYIGDWDTSAVTFMDGMFQYNTLFNQNINTKIVNSGLPNEYTAWNTSAVTTMANMFDSSFSFNQNIGSWDTSSVNSMQRMFYNGYSFNQNIGSWNVSNVTNFNGMFQNATLFNNLGSADINNWDTSSALNMNNMLGGDATPVSCKFNQPIGNWNTSLVTDMGGMFRSNTAFNQDISTKIVNAGLPNEYVAWNVSSVTNMNSMFSITPFNQDIGSWNVSNVTNFVNFMSSKSPSNYSAQNLASIYNQWSQLTLRPNLTIDFNTINYCDTAEANKQSIVTNFGWNIIDGNAVPC